MALLRTIERLKLGERIVDELARPSRGRLRDPDELYARLRWLLLVHGYELPAPTPDEVAAY